MTPRNVRGKCHPSQAILQVLPNSSTPMVEVELHSWTDDVAHSIKASFKTTNYTVNAHKAVKRKLTSLDAKYDYEVKHSHNNVVIKCQTTAYDLLRRALFVHYILIASHDKCCEINVHKDVQGTVAQTTIKVTALGSTSAKYTVNLYHTSSTILVNGRCYKEFIKDWDAAMKILHDAGALNTQQHKEKTRQYLSEIYAALNTEVEHYKALCLVQDDTTPASLSHQSGDGPPPSPTTTERITERITQDVAPQTATTQSGHKDQPRQSSSRVADPPAQTYSSNVLQGSASTPPPPRATCNPSCRDVPTTSPQGASANPSKRTSYTALSPVSPMDLAPVPQRSSPSQATLPGPSTQPASSTRPSTLHTCNPDQAAALTWRPDHLQPPPGTDSDSTDHLRRIQNALNDREAEINSRERRLRSLEKSLKAREVDLDKRQSQFETAKACIAGLERRVKALEETNRLLEQRLHAETSAGSLPDNNIPASWPQPGAVPHLNEDILTKRLLEMEHRLSTNIMVQVNNVLLSQLLSNNNSQEPKSTSTRTCSEHCPLEPEEPHPGHRRHSMRYYSRGDTHHARRRSRSYDRDPSNRHRYNRSRNRDYSGSRRHSRYSDQNHENQPRPGYTRRRDTTPESAHPGAFRRNWRHGPGADAPNRDARYKQPTNSQLPSPWTHPIRNGAQDREQEVDVDWQTERAAGRHTQLAASTQADPPITQTQQSSIDANLEDPQPSEHGRTLLDMDMPTCHSEAPKNGRTK